MTNLIKNVAMTGDDSGMGKLRGTACQFGNDHP